MCICTFFRSWKKIRIAKSERAAARVNLEEHYSNSNLSDMIKYNNQHNIIMLRRNTKNINNYFEEDCSSIHGSCLDV